MICKVWVRARGELSPARYYRYADFLRRRKYSRCEISILRNGWDVCLTAGICIAMRLASMMLGASMANVISTERPFPACPRGQVIAKYFIVMVFISFISIIAGYRIFVKLKDCKDRKDFEFEMPTYTLLLYMYILCECKIKRRIS